MSIVTCWGGVNGRMTWMWPCFVPSHPSHKTQYKSWKTHTFARLHVCTHVDAMPMLKAYVTSPASQIWQTPVELPKGWCKAIGYVKHDLWWAEFLSWLSPSFWMFCRQSCCISCGFFFHYTLKLSVIKGF
jgi:hypothetical protein